MKVNKLLIKVTKEKKKTGRKFPQFSECLVIYQFQAQWAKSTNKQEGKQLAVIAST